MAHGSKFHRHQGSNGACSSPSRVFKGKGMPGHMGCVKVTVQNLEVVRVDAENNLLLVKGAVPGAKKCLVTVKETVKAKEETLEEFIEETRFEVKPSLWERVKQSKLVQAIKRLTRIRIVIDVPALPEGRGK